MGTPLVFALGLCLGCCCCGLRQRRIRAQQLKASGATSIHGAGGLEVRSLSDLGALTSSDERSSATKSASVDIDDNRPDSPDSFPESFLTAESELGLDPDGQVDYSFEPSYQCSPSKELSPCVKATRPQRRLTAQAAQGEAVRAAANAELELKGAELVRAEAAAAAVVEHAEAQATKLVASAKVTAESMHQQADQWRWKWQLAGSQLRAACQVQREELAIMEEEAREKREDEEEAAHKAAEWHAKHEAWQRAQEAEEAAADVLSAAEEQAAKVREAAAVEASRMRESAATAAEAARAAAVAAATELIAAHHNVARSVLSSELRVTDAKAKAVLDEAEEDRQAQDEAEAEAEAVLCRAKRKAELVLKAELAASCLRASSEAAARESARHRSPKGQKEAVARVQSRLERIRSEKEARKLNARRPSWEETASGTPQASSPNTSPLGSPLHTPTEMSLQMPAQMSLSPAPETHALRWLMQIETSEGQVEVSAESAGDDQDTTV